MWIGWGSGECGAGLESGLWWRLLSWGQRIVRLWLRTGRRLIITTQHLLSIKSNTFYCVLLACTKNKERKIDTCQGKTCLWIHSTCQKRRHRAKRILTRSRVGVSQSQLSAWPCSPSSSSPSWPPPSHPRSRICPMDGARSIPGNPPWRRHSL